MLSHEFKATRIKAGFTQPQLASALSCAVRNLSYYESGERKVPGCTAGIMRLLSSGRIELSEIKELCS
jgi:transcriptional regulator with XRE-family HTH domain